MQAHADEQREPPKARKGKWPSREHGTVETESASPNCYVFHDEQISPVQMKLYFDPPGGRGARLNVVEIVGATTRAEEAKALRRLPNHLQEIRAWLDYNRAAILRLAGERRGSRPYRKLTPTFLRVIADEYAKLCASGEAAPGKVLATRHGVNASTASRWVQRARDADGLAPR